MELKTETSREHSMDSMTALMAELKTRHSTEHSDGFDNDGAEDKSLHLELKRELQTESLEGTLD